MILRNTFPKPTRPCQIQKFHWSGHAKNGKGGEIRSDGEERADGPSHAHAERTKEGPEDYSISTSTAERFDAPAKDS